MRRLRLAPVASLAMLALAIVAGSAGVRAQTGTRVYRVGILGGSGLNPKNSDAFRDALREHGWVEGRNLAIVYRAAAPGPRLAEVAAELVRMSVDAIVATNPSTAMAVRTATKTIPIVMVYGPDPVETGLVATLARPGGNVTGLTSLSGDLSVKQLELLSQMMPGLARVGVMSNPSSLWHQSGVSRLHTAARALSIRIQPVVAVSAPEQLEPAFSALTRERAEAVLVLADPVTFGNRARLAELALKHRLPMMNGLTEYTESGGLASYWPNSPEMFRRAAGYVDRILNGARPADLPIEQPTKFEFVINGKTARALGLTIPPSVLARADHVIE